MMIFIKYRTAIFLFFFSAGIVTKAFINPHPTSIFLVSIPILFTLIKYPRLYFIFFLPLGFFLTPDYAANPDIAIYSGKKISAIGTLIKNPEYRENSTRLFIKLNSINPGNRELSVNTDIVAYLENTDLSLTYGDKIELQKIKLEKIKNFKNPGSFNIEEFYKRKNIFYTAFIKKRNIKVLGKGNYVNPFLYKVNLIRGRYGSFVRRNTKYPACEIITALTVGDKSNIPEDVREIFSGLGISHIFAISGLHVGAIAVACYLLFKWLLKRSEYILLTFQMPKIAAILTIIPVFFYTALAGFSISSVRALIMVSIYLLSIVLGKDDLKLNTLFVAAIAILLINPYSLFELSFQLSFLSVFGILIMHSFYPLEIHSGYDKIKSAFKTSVSATLITLPIIINTFGYLPVFSVPANLVLIPLVEFIIVPLGLISLVTYRLSSSLSVVFLKADTFFISILIRITVWIDGLGLAIIRIPKINITTTIFLFLTAILILFRSKYRKINYLIPSAVVILVLLGINNFYKHSMGMLEIDILDSGNKNIALIRTPSSETILVNGGYSAISKSDFIEKSIVNPYLMNRNITKIDHLVLTSLDNSHINGAVALLRKIDVKTIWINGYKLNSQLWEQIYEKNIILNKLSNEGSTLSFDGLTMNFLRPETLQIYDSKRPVPLLLEINYGNFTFHMGEDLERAEFNNKKSNLLYSPEVKNINYGNIINNYDPDIIVCRKCSKNSKDQKIKIYETVSDGTLSVFINHNSIKIEEYIE